MRKGPNAQSIWFIVKLITEDVIQVTHKYFLINSEFFTERFKLMINLFVAKNYCFSL
jgi:hypothetical protein